VVGGIMGAFFIGVNFKMNAWRKQLLKSDMIKPFETALWSIMTSSFFIIVPYLMYISQDGICLPLNSLDDMEKNRVYQGWCRPD